MKPGYDEKKMTEFCRRHDLELLVLHGSQARGTFTDRSDIDVGFLSKGKVDFKKYRAMLDDFSGVFGDKFDPVFLNGAEPLICYQVAISGCPLYEKTSGTFANFRLQSIGRYFDTKKFRELEKSYIKRAVRENNHD